MSTGGSRRAVFAALLANLGIAVAKFVGFFFTASSSMLAEGVHSLADTGNQLLLLLGGHRARKAPTPAHPFGFGRERYFWAFVVSIVLFALGSLFAIFEGVEKLLDPHELDSPQWAIGILLVAIVLEGSSFRTAVHESNPLRQGASWPEFIRRSKAPELPVLLLEDSGALIGLAVALVAVVLSVVTGSGIWDGIGSTLIGLLLGVIAVVLATEMKSLLIGESATEADEQRIVGAIDGEPAVRRLIHLRTEHLGPEELLVGAKIDFRRSLTMPELALAIDAVEAAIRRAVPSARVIYLEPDIARSDPTGPAEPAATDGPTPE
jgi:cation diffusion facilitator family transporter